MTREDAYFQAMAARDPRFDGKFFVGVKTTGVYCRPICPAKPKRENCEFFPNPAAAERAGYRPCLRCRPEAAPLSPAWIGKSAVVQRALKVLHQQETLSLDEDRFAEKFGVTARHLRRLFVEEIGKTPKQLAFENRLNLARKLIVETRLPLSEVAFASGFESIRRFNDACRERFRRSPTQMRRKPALEGAPVRITLPYRPPFLYSALIHVYRNHAVGDLEWFEGEKMFRVFHAGGRTGVVGIENDEARSRLVVEIDFPDSSQIFSIAARVRALFDLDSDPVMIANAFASNAKLRRLLAKHPGIRLASGWDPYEVAVAAILGQVVSVERGRALVSELIARLGREAAAGERKVKLFPAPADVAAADLGFLKTTGGRKAALQALSRALAEGSLSLEPTQDIEQFMKRLLAIKGVGVWTAEYIALRGLRHADAFPGSDLILARALKLHPSATIEALRPWRGYAAALLWREYAGKV